MIVFISSLPGQRPPCGLRLWSGAAGPVLAGQATLLVELGCDADVRGVSPVSQYSIQSPSAVVKLELWPGQRFGDKRTSVVGKVGVLIAAIICRCGQRY